MNLAWRIAIYLVLAVVAVFASQRFFAGFSREMDRAAQRFETSDLTRSEVTEPAAIDPNSATNEPVVALDPPGATSEAVATNRPPDPRRAAPPATVAAPHKGLYGAVALIAVLALGLMVGRDVAGYLGQRVQREIYGEASEPVGDPEYDEAEEVWANGDHLEAIRLLREFLNNKPSKLHAAFRIAEIYEKDLQNNLAAALEYETILEHRFEPDRWGWAAIHLVNLYNRLGQTSKADALLQRIVEQHPGTEAAGKARERLGWPVDGTASDADDGGEPPPPDDGSFHLPRGFKPKKG
jgi:hypothetical protein